MDFKTSKKSISSPEIDLGPAGIIHSPNFKRWFEGSKVVNDQGSPLVVFHGTKETAFDTFNSDLIGQSGRSEGAGFYFTTERSVAEGYGERGRVLEVYLNIKNPMRYEEPAFSRAKTVELISVVAKIEARKEEMDIRDGFLSNFADTYSGSIERAYQVAADLLCEEDDALSQIGSLIGSGVSADIVNSGLYQALGFDGFLAKGFSGMGKSGGQIWIAMKPQQIKSATENCGLFDPENPNFKS